MTPERRLEMQMYRKAAVELEEKRKNLKAEQAKRPLESKLKPAGPGQDMIEMSPPPITVTGRSRQQLQFSETLIYDNKQNSIIKFVKSCRSGEADREKALLKTLRSKQLPETPAPMWPQRAVIRERPLTYQSATIILEPSAKPSLVMQSPKTSQRSPTRPPPFKEPLLGNPLPAPCEETIKNMLDVARKLNKQSYNAGRALYRSNTSPALSPLMALQSSCSSSNDRDERLPWKRYNSYPPYLSKLPSHPAEATAPISPNTSGSQFCQSVNKPWLPIPIPMPITITRSSNNSYKLPNTPHPQPEEKIIAKTLSRSHPKNASSGSSSNSRTSKRTPRASSTVNFTAHASSHAKADGTNSDHGARMSSTHRRLSYNPRATLQRATRRQRSKASSTAGETSQAIPRAPSSSSCGHSDALRRKTLMDKMEQQQRVRFEQLISLQADEQRRLQEDFKAQQQLLQEQLEANEEPEQANSDNSSLNSLILK